MYDNFNSVRETSLDFLCVGVSGLGSDSLLRGRPYGGCSILYRKSLSLSVTPLHSCSNRFCGKGFIFSHSCDVNIAVGDFNVDFDHGGHLASLPLDFMANLGLIFVSAIVFVTLMKVIAVLPNLG